MLKAFSRSDLRDRICLRGAPSASSRDDSPVLAFEMLIHRPVVGRILAQVHCPPDVDDPQPLDCPTSTASPIRICVALTTRRVA